MNTKIKTIIFAIAMALSVTSCLEDVPLKDDALGKPQSLMNMQNAFVKATNNLTPMSMKKDEWAFFRIQAKLYTGDFQGLGYKAAQVITTPSDATITVDGKDYDSRNLNIVVTDYKEPVGDNDPEIDVQKEWDCKFIKPPYYLWYGECALPPEQNLWVFQGVNEEVVQFFSLARYSQKEKLPQKLIDENRCYGFENCEINVNYLEYDMMVKKNDGTYKRYHYKAGFSGELPYLASNVKTCYDTIIELDGHEHPGEVCQELVNFEPGN